MVAHVAVVVGAVIVTHAAAGEVAAIAAIAGDGCGVAAVTSGRGTR